MHVPQAPESGGDNLPEIPSPARGAPPAPYSAFPLSDADVETASQLETLLADPAAAPYLRNHGGKGKAKAALGALACVVAIAAAYLIPSWNMFAGYAPPRVSDVPKPAPFEGGTPLAFRDRVQAINSDLNSARWRGAFEKLKAFIDDIGSSDDSAPPDLTRWARTEILVALASKEIPPSLYDDSYPSQVFSALTSAPDEPGAAMPPPFRAASSYVKVLHSLPREKNGEAERTGTILDALDLLRAEYPSQMDENRDLLFIEAENHIAALPAEYVANDRDLEYHWRRASYAIGKLYELFGKTDSAVRSVDKKRWLSVRRYFDLTLLTWDVGRIGWLKSVTLDGKEYDKESVTKILEQL